MKFIVIILIACLAGFFGFKSCNQDMSITENMKAVGEDGLNKLKDGATGAVTDLKDGATNVVAGLGDFFSFKLPNGVELSIPSNGIENNLIKFISGGDDIAKDKWFNFDRINFNTGSSTLSEESAEQVGNITNILKAFPNVTLKVGGYTDNTGNADLNKNLSQKRADAVKNAIVGLGVDGARIMTEGYGDAHPVASNETDEGRAQNRRIAINVTAK